MRANLKSNRELAETMKNYVEKESFLNSFEMKAWQMVLIRPIDNSSLESSSYWQDCPVNKYKSIKTINIKKTVRFPTKSLIFLKIKLSSFINSSRFIKELKYQSTVFSWHFEKAKNWNFETFFSYIWSYLREFNISIDKIRPGLWSSESLVTFIYLLLQILRSNSLHLIICSHSFHPFASLITFIGPFSRSWLAQPLGSMPNTPYGQ